MPDPIKVIQKYQEKIKEGEWQGSITLKIDGKRIASIEIDLTMKERKKVIIEEDE